MDDEIAADLKGLAGILAEEVHEQGVNDRSWTFGQEALRGLPEGDYYGARSRCGWT